MRALVAEAEGAPAAVRERREPSGDGTLLAARWSSVNYKDALAVSGRPGILRSHPLVPGIDAVGTAGGREVVVTGAGLGERRDGGFAERVLIDPATAVPVPPVFGGARAAAIGTAGVTAALAVLALEREGIPDGPVLVTGAGGGVGGFAVALLAAGGREVHASTGRPELADHLTALGAARVGERLPAEPGRPLQPARWAGVVDSVGGGALVNALAQTLSGGTVAACGLAASADLPGSVLPFILRGVTLAGIFSVDMAAYMRVAAWDLLTARLRPEVVDRMVGGSIGLDGLPDAAASVLAGDVRGRILVEVAAS